MVLFNMAVQYDAYLINDESVSRFCILSCGCCTVVSVVSLLDTFSELVAKCIVHRLSQYVTFEIQGIMQPFNIKFI